MLVRKLRLARGWSQETLAQISGLSVRTIQRTERGEKPSLETQNALAAVLDVDLSTLTQEHTMQSPAISEDEREALEYVRDIKGFYTHALTYALVIAVLFGINLIQGLGYPWFLWPALGWGIGLASHGVSVFELFSLFSPDWERRQVERRLAKRKG